MTGMGETSKSSSGQNGRRGPTVTAGKKAKRRGGYFRSRVFKRLFLSYALIILVLFGFFIVWAGISYRREAEDLARKEWEQKGISWGNWMDQQLMQAQMLCAAVNASESARSALQTVYVEKGTMNALQLYNLLGELNRIKGSARSAGLYSLILAFQGERKVFLPGTVYSLNGECRVLQSSPYLGMTTAAGLLGVSGPQIILNKEFLIYGEAYTGFGSRSSTKGEVLVLIEKDQLLASLREKTGEAAVRITRRGQPVLESGTAGGVEFRVRSQADGTVEYTTIVPESALRRPIPVSALLPLAIMAMAAILSVALTYRIARRYYKPIDDIRRLVPGPEAGDKKEEAAPGNGANEFDHILQGISSLIGERNGYREKMVTITPYARQGILQAAIRGAGSAETLVQEQFTELKRKYYMVGVVNFTIVRDIPAAEKRYRDLQSLLISLCRETDFVRERSGEADTHSSSGQYGRRELAFAEEPDSVLDPRHRERLQNGHPDGNGEPEQTFTEEGQSEEFQLAAVPENLQNTYVIAAGDSREGFEDFFYRFYHTVEENLGDESTLITIGTGRRESDLERLNAACLEAKASLGQMLTGGRGAVYFPEDRRDNEPGYYFPKDAQKQMVRMLRERNLEGLNGMLDDIYQKNLVEADLPAEQIRQMADELYWTIRKALRNAFDLSTTHVRMEPIRDAATIEEIFAYYRQVFEASLAEDAVGEGEAREKDLETEITRYLEEHIYDPDLSLNGVADRFGVSTKMVGLICRKKYNQTFLAYVRDRQIQRAKELLRETDLSLEEIAARCGFSNILTFRRNFKSVTGVNPSEYRE